MLPGCRMQTFMSVNMSRRWDRVMFGPPDEAEEVLKNAGINYGLLFTAWGVAGIIGPRIAGVLFDKYKNYQMAFYTAAVLAAVALLCELVARRPQIPSQARTAVTVTA